MAGLQFNRIGWLLRRISRIYPAEVPYRVATVLRAAAQSNGWFDATRVPPRAADGTWGNSWVRLPTAPACDATALVARADRILTDGVPVFDVFVGLSNAMPDWNRDPKTGQAIPKSFGLSIDFRHIAGGVDIKYLWELNRHVWWVPIAQAYAATNERRFLDTLRDLLDSWLTDCPYPLGANWSSPVEHGIRLINWSIVWSLIGGQASPLFKTPDGKLLCNRWMTSIYQHMRFASDNYSFHSSADNHLIGEAAGIFVAASTWDLWAEGRVMGARARDILEAEMLKQFAPDGVNLEQALCYHKFSLEFMLAAMLAGANNGYLFLPEFQNRMRLAIEFIAAMMDCNGRVPAIGDSDDGKVFDLATSEADSAYLAMLQAGAAIFKSPVLREKLRLLGKEQPRAAVWLVVADPAEPTAQPYDAGAAWANRFPQGGYAILGDKLHTRDEYRLTMDTGPLGSNRIAGHGHADALSMLLSVAGQDFLVDPGTYCYNAAPELRHYFRGTGAHNTALIDGTDQSIYGGSFLWLRDVHTRVHSFVDDGVTVAIAASHDGYRRLPDPVTHTRSVTLDRQTLSVLVEDHFDCGKPHQCELRWHFAPACDVAGANLAWTAQRPIGTLSIALETNGFSANVTTGAENPAKGWYSERFYEKQASPVLVFQGTIGPGAVVRTRLAFSLRDAGTFLRS